jgi:hypothetical protein
MVFFGGYMGAPATMTASVNRAKAGTVIIAPNARPTAGTVMMDFDSRVFLRESIASMDANSSRPCFTRGSPLAKHMLGRHDAIGGVSSVA